LDEGYRETSLGTFLCAEAFWFNNFKHRCFDAEDQGRNRWPFERFAKLTDIHTPTENPDWPESFDDLQMMGTIYDQYGQIIPCQPVYVDPNADYMKNAIHAPRILPDSNRHKTFSEEPPKWIIDFNAGGIRPIISPNLDELVEGGEM
jgi:hypothetical protein